jgi:hypothetical protein
VLPLLEEEAHGSETQLVLVGDSQQEPSAQFTKPKPGKLLQLGKQVPPELTGQERTPPVQEQLPELLEEEPEDEVVEEHVSGAQLLLLSQHLGLPSEPH